MLSKAVLLSLLESKAIGDFRGLRARDLIVRSTPATTAREADRIAGAAQDAMARLIHDTDEQMSLLITQYIGGPEAQRARQKGTPGYEGTITAAQLSRSLSEILRRVYYEIFLLGARSSRNPKAVNFTSFTPEETEWIQRALRQEQGFLDKLVKGIVRNKDRWSLGYMKRRLRNYAESARGMFESGKVAGLSPLSIIHWETRSDRGTCRECFLLRDFGPYLRHTLPCTPKSGCTRCLMNCRCTLRVQPATADQIKVLQAMAYDRRYYLKLLTLSRSRPDNLPRVRGRQPAQQQTRRRRRA